MEESVIKIFFIGYFSFGSMPYNSFLISSTCKLTMEALSQRLFECLLGTILYNALSLRFVLNWFKIHMNKKNENYIGEPRLVFFTLLNKNLPTLCFYFGRHVFWASEGHVWKMCLPSHNQLVLVIFYMIKS